MKAKFNWLVLACALLFANSARAQGTIYFSNRFPPVGLDAPVTLDWLTGPGPVFSASLYLLQGQNLTLIPNSTTTFQDGYLNPSLAKYIYGLTVFVPGTVPGQVVTVRMRAWLSAAGSFEAANPGMRGESGDLRVVLGGLNDPSENNYLPSSFTGFRIYTTGPEPTTWALFGMGLFAFAVRSRWRKR